MNTIQQYSIYLNDDNTYNLTIAFNGYEVNYPRVKFDFAGNEVLAFPISMQVLKADCDEVINSFSVVEPQAQPEEQDVLGEPVGEPEPIPNESELPIAD